MPKLWITNHPKSIKGLWPRRKGVEYIEDKPKGTNRYTSEELTQQGMIGVYVNITAEEYFKLPLISSPKEL